MAKKTFQGRPVLSGKLEGKALLSKQPFNLTGSYLKNMFGGETKSAPTRNYSSIRYFSDDVLVKIIVTGKIPKGA